MHLFTSVVQITSLLSKWSWKEISLKIVKCFMISDRQNNEHIRENRTKNRTNIRQNRILQKLQNIFLFILLELYWIIRQNIFVFILQNNQTKLHSCLWMCFKNIKCYSTTAGNLNFNVHCFFMKQNGFSIFHTIFIQ